MHFNNARVKGTSFTWSDMWTEVTRLAEGEVQPCLVQPAIYRGYGNPACSHLEFGTDS